MFAVIAMVLFIIGALGIKTTLLLMVGLALVAAHLAFGDGLSLPTFRRR
jgi:hypothetical protein